LHAVVETIVEGNLRDGRINGHLKLLTVKLRQCPLNDLVVFRARIDEQGVADHIGRDPHSLQQRLASAGATWGAALESTRICCARCWLTAERAERPAATCGPAAKPRSPSAAEATPTSAATDTANGA